MVHKKMSTARIDFIRQVESIREADCERGLVICISMRGTSASGFGFREAVDSKGFKITPFILMLYLQNGIENQAAFAEGRPLVHILTFSFFLLTLVSGNGGTLGLNIDMLLFAKSDRYKTLDKLAIAPFLVSARNSGPKSGVLEKLAHRFASKLCATSPSSAA